MMSSSKSGFHFYICGYWGVLLVAKVSKVVFIFGYCAMCALCIGQSTKTKVFKTFLSNVSFFKSEFVKSVLGVLADGPTQHLQESNS